jgi:hypothetical protein
MSDDTPAWAAHEETGPLRWVHEAADTERLARATGPDERGVTDRGLGPAVTSSTGSGGSWRSAGLRGRRRTSRSSSTQR